MKLIILDRDGVINQDSPFFIKSPDEWHPIAGSLEAIARLNHARYKVMIATNQSGLGRGLFDQQQLDAIHQKMQQQLAQVNGHIDGIFFCPHTPEDHCHCRKPKPGLLQTIAHQLQTDLDAVPVIGDALRDIQAAQAVNAKPILVLTGKGTTTAPQIPEVPSYPNLAEAVDHLLKQR